VRVSWYDANAFLAKLRTLNPQGGYRIPSGREWMSAARAGGQSLLTSSAETANCNNKETNDGYEDTAPVGSFLPNARGLYDMAGNVSEWVSDSDGSGTKKIRRGGSFENVPKNCSITYFTSSKPDALYSNTGFRIVRDPIAPK
jgi:formylglycine-generating enzyme required for sulfatase activity